MLDELRKQAVNEFSEENAPTIKEKPRRFDGRFLGMTAFQRFFLSLMVLLITCLLGSFCLIATQTIDITQFF
jgi:hypothetical protein